MKFIAAVLLMVSFAVAQDAVVVELSQSDAGKAKTLYAAKQKADADWDAFTAEIGQRHKLFSFEFSKDFRFVVPKFTANWGTFPKFQNCSAYVDGTCWYTSTPLTGSWISDGNLTINATPLAIK